MNELIEKPFELVNNKEDMKILKEITTFLPDFMVSLSDIQVGKLVLNNIEYPTAYSKIKQCKAELCTRYNSLIDIYFDLKKKEIEIEMKTKDLLSERDDLKKKLIELEKEKLVLQVKYNKTKINNVMKEMHLYYKYYIIYNKEIINMNKESLEIDMWKEKALKNPIVFEERYGDFIKEILGEENYKQYLSKRKQHYGQFPRELIMNNEQDK